MSFNVRYGLADDGPNRWEVRAPRTLSILQRHRPELVGLQEAMDFQLDALLSVGGYVAVGAGREDGRSGGEHAAILYDPSRLRLLRSDTFWLSDTPEVIGSKTWDHRVTRVCTWTHFRDLANGREFYHFNAHLDHESAGAREKGIELILRRIATRSPQDPVVLTGDFNCGEGDPVIDQVRAAGLRDTFRVMHSEAEGVTFNGWDPEPTGDKIDYIFVEPRTAVMSAEVHRELVDGGLPSDHFPISATITFFE